MASKKPKEVKQEKPKGLFGNFYDPSITYEALKNANLLPQWAQQTPANESNSGEYIPATNSLIAPGNLENNPYNKSTLSHEMTHAVQHNLLRNVASNIMAKQWKGGEVTEQEKQFVQAASKLFNESYGTVGQFDYLFSKKNLQDNENTVNALYKNKSGDRSFDMYRTSPREAQAFGIGNMSQGGMQGSERSGIYNQHLDPSFATEFNILLSMYGQLPKGVRQVAEQERKASVEKQRASPYNSPTAGYDFENVFKDPFAPTIK